MRRNVDRTLRLNHKPLFIALLIATTGKVFAQDTYHYFDLPGQTLQSGLVELALQADITVVANHELIRGHRSAPLIGPYTPRQALEKLLARAPLNFQFDAQTNSFVILPSISVSEPEPASPSSQPEETLVEEVVVYAPSYPFRYNTVSNTQFSDGSAIYDNSRFHTVLPAELIQDLMPLAVEDLLMNASGISPADGRSDTNDDFYMRGFPRHAFYVDGFRVENTTGARFLPDNIEQVEILKGPSTIRFGQGEPGGMVNLVRKRPSAEPIGRLQISAGDNGLRKISADIGNPFSSRLSYRVNLVNAQQENSADIDDLQQQMFAPSMRWQPVSGTDLNLSYEFQKAEQYNANDFPLALPDAEENFPGIRFDQVIRHADPGFRSDRHLLHASGTQVIDNSTSNTGWRVRGNFVWQEEDRSGIRGSTDYLNSDLLFGPGEIGNLYLMLVPGGQIAIPAYVRPNPQDPTDPLIYIGEVRSLYDEQSSETGLQSTVEIDGTLVLLGLQHHVNMGIDWRRQDLFQSTTIESRRPLPFQSWPESDGPSLNYFFDRIFDPNRPLGALELFEFRQVSDEYGIYFQNTFSISEKLSLTAGARMSRIEVERERFKQQERIQLDPAQKLRLQSGLHYQLTDDLQLFANYAQGLRSNQAKGGFGATINEPELSDQWEAGIKGFFMDGRLSAALAGYRINKTNIYWIDSFSLNGFALQEYGQRVLGADLDFTFQYSRQTQIIGSFSAQDNELTYGPYTGNIPAASTPNTASIFLNHHISDAFSANIGGYYTGHRYADHANNFEIDAFYLIDAGLQYQTHFGNKSLAVQIKCKNLLDRDYYSDVVAGIRFNQGEGRQIIASVLVEL